jgi:hypothetical protein
MTWCNNDDDLKEDALEEDDVTRLRGQTAT